MKLTTATVSPKERSVRFPDAIKRVDTYEVLHVWTRKGWFYIVDRTGQVWRCRKIKAKVVFE